MRRLCLHLLLLAFVAGLPLLLSGCAGRGKQQGADTAATMPRMIGKVSTVRDALNFVLIDSSEHLQAGLKLETMDPISRTETGKLTVSTQQSHPFFIGDIIDGTPKIGDWVIRPGRAAAPAQSGAAPNAPPSDLSDPSMTAPLPANLPSEVPRSLPPVPSLEPLPSLPPISNLPPLEDTP